MTELSNINVEIVRKSEKVRFDIEARLTAALSEIGQNHVALVLGCSVSHVSKNSKNMIFEAAQILAALGVSEFALSHERIVPKDDLSVLPTLSAHGFEHLRGKYK